MEILVERFESEVNHTLSRVYVNGVFECFAIEDEYRAIKIKGETRIPEGEYKLGCRQSPSHANAWMLWVKDVPGFQFILIHAGNTEKDTEGCLVIGKRVGSISGARAVLDSKQAVKEFYEKVMPEVEAKKEVTIKYISI